MSGAPPSVSVSPQAPKPAPLPGDSLKESQVVEVAELGTTKVIELDEELMEEDELPDESQDA